jgi:hypothetical protein
MHKRIHLQTWHSPDGHTFNQIDHCLIDGRHFSDVIDVMARRGANIDSDHMLVVIKLRARICRASNTKLQQLRRFAVDRLKDRDVASRYYDELESELQGVQAQPLSLDEKCKKLEETIQRIATNTIGCTRTQANKEWFDEECAKVNEEKNAARDSWRGFYRGGGGPNLVDALHEVIQQAWTSETLRRNWTEGVLCPVYKKGDKIDCKNYRGICLSNVTYKVLAKIIYDRLLK